MNKDIISFLKRVRKFATTSRTPPTDAENALACACDSFIAASTGQSGLKRSSKPAAAEWYHTLVSEVGSLSPSIAKLFELIATSFPDIGKLILDAWGGVVFQPTGLAPGATMRVPVADPGRHSTVEDAVCTGLYLYQASTPGGGSTAASSILVLDPERAAEYWQLAKFYKPCTMIWPAEPPEIVGTDFLVAGEKEVMLLFQRGCFSFSRPECEASKAFLNSNGRLCIPFGQNSESYSFAPRQAVTAELVVKGVASECLIIDPAILLKRFVTEAMLPAEMRPKVTIKEVTALDGTEAAFRECQPFLCYPRDELAIDLFPDAASRESDFEAALNQQATEIGNVDPGFRDWRLLSTSQLRALEEWTQRREDGWLTRKEWLEYLGIAPSFLVHDEFPPDSWDVVYKSIEIPEMEDLYKSTSMQELAKKPGCADFVKAVLGEDYKFVVRILSCDTARAVLLADCLAS